MNTNINLMLTGKHFIEQREYWTDKLSVESEQSNLFPYMKPFVSGEKVHTIHSIHLDQELSFGLFKMCNNNDLSLYAMLMTGLNSLIYKYTGNTDINIVSPVYQQFCTEDTLNEYVVIKASLNSLTTYRDLVIQLGTTLEEAYENQDYPMEDILSRINALGAQDKSYYLNLGCELRNIHGDKQNLSQCNVIFSFERKEKEIIINLKYNHLLYDTYLIIDLLDKYESILQVLKLDINQIISKTELLTTNERNRLVYEFNDTASNFSLNQTIPEIFEIKASMNGEQSAIVAEDTEKFELWPSLGEYPIYDEMLYQAMTNDRVRNEKYKKAIENSVKDKVVVDIGTGADAVLALMCIDAGAKKVYAIEIMEESYLKAKKLISRLGLQDKIILLHGDSTKIDLPEKVDICVSEIIGMIGGSEGAEVVLQDARKFLNDSGKMIPSRCVSKIAVVSLPNDFEEKMGFSELSTKYIEYLFNQGNARFDFRVCIDNLSRKHLVSNEDIFEDLHFGSTSSEYEQKIVLTINKDSKIQGFLIWVNLHVQDNIEINVMDSRTNWLPVFVPAFYEGIDVKKGDQIFANCIRTVSGNKINPDYKINGSLVSTSGKVTEFSYELPYFEQSYQKNTFYKMLFSNDNVKQISKKSLNKTISYADLNKRANQIAHYLRNQGIKIQDMVGIIGSSSIEICAAILGVLKVGAAYVPLDSNHPIERINYILKHSNTKVLLKHNTDTDCYHFSGRVIPLDSQEIGACGENNLEKFNHSTDLAYMIYTTGTTGDPKGVMIEHRSVVNISEWFNREYQLQNHRNVLQITNIAFDVSVEEILATLLNGATLYIPDKLVSTTRMIEYLRNNEINLAQFVPATLKEFLLEGEKLDCLRTVICGGEKLDETLKNQILQKGYSLYNHYGPTECTIDAIVAKCDIEKSEIGKPIANMRAYVVNESGELLPLGVIGELYIAGEGLARGYYNDEVLTGQKFIYSDLDQSGRLYKTGDLVRWSDRGTIEYIGRKDNQVKLRGFRIEIEEIESVFSCIPGMKQVAVTLKEVAGENCLCGYYVTDQFLNLEEIKTLLAQKLPAYMIPTFIMQINAIPLNANGKIDRDALPDPEDYKTENLYIAPANEVEQRLAGLWSEILGISKISTNDNFFEIGGHSLKSTNLISKIYKEFNVEVQLREIFEFNTIQMLAQYIAKLQKVQYVGIQPTEISENYPLSSAQKRLFLLDQFENINTSYNMLHTVIIEGNLNKEKLEFSFNELIHRHEPLRTSFEFINGQAIQKIHPKVDFVLIQSKAQEDRLPAIINEFIHKFDLNKAPLFRAKLIELEDNKHALMLDMHHIISDGTSMGIFIRDLIEIYRSNPLPQLQIQYKDFAQWQNSFLKTGALEDQKNYWVNQLSGEIPIINLELDYKRGQTVNFDGDIFEFELNGDMTDKIRYALKETKTTLYMYLLAVYNTLLYKYTSQEDILVGSAIAGRKSTQLDDLIGMFVNTLVMRNFPKGDKTFENFLTEIKETAIKAFENQDYQFEELVEDLDIARDMNRNPLFDVAFTVQNTYQSVIDMDDLGISFREYKSQARTSKFDLTLFVMEESEKIKCIFEYNTKLFKKSTIERMVRHYVMIIDLVLKDIQIKLDNISLLTMEEQHIQLYSFNDTQTGYPSSKPIHQLFEEQVGRTPDRIAVVYNDVQLSYKKLNAEANKLANFLTQTERVKVGSLIGILMEKSEHTLIAIMGILKAGGAYVPINPEYPKERIKTIITDSEAKIIISSRKHIKLLNELQWECPHFKTYLCMDSNNVYQEQEDNNILSNEELWKFVGDKATDEISGGGWGNSYTGEDLSKEDMDEYGDNILKKLLPHLNKNTKVLEIGCASGISMFRIAPHVGLYYGTDLSEVIIEKDKKRILRENIPNIKLDTLPADKIDTIAENGFDIVILNSVIQTFSGYSYLREVIEKIIGLMSEKGIIFFGDIMDYGLKDELIASLKEFKANNKNMNYRTKTDWSSELFLSREFILDLRCDFSSIKKVDFSDKIYTLENELTKFRYDAMLHIEKDQELKSIEKYKNQYGKEVYEHLDDKDINVACDGKQICCVVYTSGSTGKPKGTLISHLNITRIIKDTNYIDITSEDTVLQLANLSFDASLFEINGALLNGGKLIMVNKETSLDVHKIGSIIHDNKISVMLLTTAYFNMLVDTKLECLSNARKILFGGERVSVPHVKKALRFLGGDKLIHMYGPSESTTFTTYYPINRVEDEEITIPIGKPVSNTSVYVLHEDRLQPLGLPGELCISGDGIVGGYLNNPKLTTEKFVSNPFLSHGLMYKTGDLVRWLPDGNLQFIGRLDNQVKIRGFRIELGEIENVLLKHEMIREAIVMDIEAEDNDRFLSGYYVAENDITQTELQEYLATKLPDYMLPRYYYRVDKLPININGKIDKNKLKMIGVKTGVAYDLPESDTEEKMLGIWKDVLNIEQIGVNQRFFDIGGHSLKAAYVVTKIFEVFNVNLPLSEIFKNLSVREIGVQIDRLIELKGCTNSGSVDYMTLLKQGNDKQKNLFFIHTATNSSECYAKLSVYLHDDFNCWGVHFNNHDLYCKQDIDIKNLAQEYLNRIRKIQPMGPYYIVGWCIAGIIAYEIAKQLEDAGEKVDILGLIDSPTSRNKQYKFIINKKHKRNDKNKEFKMFEFVMKGIDLGNLEKIKNEDSIWDAFVKNIDDYPINEEEKEIIFKNICLFEPQCKSLLSGYKMMTVPTIILVFNTIRTLVDAIYNNYSLQGKLQADIAYFVALKGPCKDKDIWKNYSNDKISYQGVDCDHFSMFDGEAGQQLSGLLNNVLIKK